MDMIHSVDVVTVLRTLSPLIITARGETGMAAQGRGVLLGNSVRSFLEEGGHLRLEPFDAGGGKTHWLVFGISDDGDVRQIFIARNGEPKVFRSADAVVSYHEFMLPDATSVEIPLLRREGQGADPDRPGDD